MKQLDKYLIRQFTTILTMAIVGFVTIFVVVDLIENLDKFIDNSIPLRIILLLYIYLLPWFFSIGLPMATLIATVFSIGLIAKRNEWTAMKSSGISLYRVAIPLLLIGLLLSAISFELDNTLVSQGNSKRSELEQKYFKRGSSRSIFKQRKVLYDVLLQKKAATHISLAKYKVSEQKAEGVTVFTLINGRLKQRIDAHSIVWNDSVSKWSVTDYSFRSFDRNGLEQSVVIALGDTLVAANFNPGDITKQFKSPDELNYSELGERIALLQENGVKTVRWEVARHFKISFSFTCLIVILFGLPLAVAKQKGGLAFAAGMSVAIIFGYYAFIKFGQSMGFNEILNPFLGAWIGNIVFAAGGIILLLSVRK